MNNEEQMVAALNKMVELQEQSLGVQREVLENQLKAVANQERAIGNQFATGRLYRVSLVALAIMLGVLAYFVSGWWS